MILVESSNIYAYVHANPLSVWDKFGLAADFFPIGEGLANTNTPYYFGYITPQTTAYSGLTSGERFVALGLVGVLGGWLGGVRFGFAVLGEEAAGMTGVAAAGVAVDTVSNGAVMGTVLGGAAGSTAGAASLLLDYSATTSPADGVVTQNSCRAGP